MPDRQPFPFEAVRDALGVVRLLYATRQRAGRLPAPPEIDPLVSIGKDLATALALAKGCDPGALGPRAATTRAGAALQRLADVMTMSDHLPSVVRIARERATWKPALIGTRAER